VESLTWKSVFYRFIEDYRKRIRKHTSAESSGASGAKESLARVRPPSAGSNSSPPPPHPPSSPLQTISEFSVFLHDGVVYYNRLSARLRVRSTHPSSNRAASH
jgi:hypothetical protein